MKIPKKRGQLGLEEQEFIRKNIGTLSIEEIAGQLNRTIKPIERYISDAKIGTKTLDEQENDKTLRQKLHVKTFWREITKQFDKETGELDYFEDTWIGLVKQFREDVLPAEELQIKPSIINKAIKIAHKDNWKSHEEEWDEIEMILGVTKRLPE